MKKNLTLGQWLIEKTDGEAYRAGKLHGEKHPEVDQRLINKIGNLKKLLSQAREMEKDPELKGLIRFDWRDMGNDIRTIHYSVEIIPLLCDKEGIEDPRKRQQRYIEKSERVITGSVSAGNRLVKVLLSFAVRAFRTRETCKRNGRRSVVCMPECNR